MEELQAQVALFSAVLVAVEEEPHDSCNGRIERELHIEKRGGPDLGTRLSRKYILRRRIGITEFMLSFNSSEQVGSSCSWSRASRRGCSWTNLAGLSLE